MGRDPKLGREAYFFGRSESNQKKLEIHQIMSNTQAMAVGYLSFICIVTLNLYVLSG